MADESVSVTLDALTVMVSRAYANRTRLTNELAQCERDIVALEVAVSHIERSMCGLPPLPTGEVLRERNSGTIDWRMRAIGERWAEK